MYIACRPNKWIDESKAKLCDFGPNRDFGENDKVNTVNQGSNMTTWWNLHEVICKRLAQKGTRQGGNYQKKAKNIFFRQVVWFLPSTTISGHLMCMAAHSLNFWNSLRCHPCAFVWRLCIFIGPRWRLEIWILLRLFLDYFRTFGADMLIMSWFLSRFCLLVRRWDRQLREAVTSSF